MSALGLLAITSTWGTGMVNFDMAVEFVLQNEGGLVENENDAGGITNFGISLRFLRSLDDAKLKKYGIFIPPDAESVKELSREQARTIYFGEFWEKSGIIGLREQNVANYLFDMMVNMGTGQAVKILQRATWALTCNVGCIKDDGIMGEMTLSLANAFASGEVIPVLMAIRAEFYRSLDRPAFLNGWLKRTYRI